MRRRRNEIMGQTFGRLTVMRDTGERMNDGRNVIWECWCDCGGTAFVTTSNLVSGNTKSCGCLRVEKLADAREARRRRREKPD